MFIACVLDLIYVVFGVTTCRFSGLLVGLEVCFNCSLYLVGLLLWVAGLRWVGFKVGC